MRILFGFITATMAFGQEQAPPVLTDALRTLDGVRILEPRFLDPKIGTLAQLKHDHAWSPWAVGDTDRDDVQDVIAVVVKPTPKGPQYGVVAVHGSEPNRIHWVVPMDKTIINGVALDHAGFIEPRYCVYCDANPWYNWTGSAYRAEVFGVGQVLAVGEDIPGADTVVDLVARATEGSRIVGRVKGGTRATVVAIRGTDFESRWYLVDAHLAKALRGWIPGSYASTWGLKSEEVRGER
jgi:hypothetical protein